MIVWSALTAAMLRYATPLAFAAMGGIFSERSGVVNIGLEGMMLSGAFFGILGADKFNSWQLGLLCAALSGAAFALIHAFFAIHLRADQIVGGTAINFLALGVTGYLFIDIYGGEGTPPDIPGIPNVHLSFLEDWYFIGPVLGDLNLMIWLAFFTIVAHLDRALQDAGRPPPPCRRRASARGRHGRDLRLQDALRGGRSSPGSSRRSAARTSRSGSSTPSTRT